MVAERGHTEQMLWIWSDVGHRYKAGRFSSRFHRKNKPKTILSSPIELPDSDSVLGRSIGWACGQLYAWGVGRGCGGGGGGGDGVTLFPLPFQASAIIVYHSRLIPQVPG